MTSVEVLGSQALDLELASQKLNAVSSPANGGAPFARNVTSLHSGFREHTAETLSASSVVLNTQKFPAGNLSAKIP